MWMRLQHRITKRRERIPRLGLAKNARERPEDRPILARFARREARAEAHLRTTFQIDEDARLFGIGGARQNHIRPMRAPVPMAAMIDHKGPRRDVDLIGAKIVDKLRTFEA